MPIYHNENPCILYKGDRHPAALYMGDKLIMGYQRNVVSGETVNIDSAYNDTPGLVAQGKSTQDKGVKGTNLITNGDFSNGTTGWTVVNAVVNGVAEKTATYQYAKMYFAYPQSSALRGHVIYMGARFKADSTAVGITATDGVNQVFAYSSGNSIFEIKGLVKTVRTDASLVHFALQDNRTSGWTKMYLSYAIAIDLTAAFGAGNEPTAAQMDAMLAQYPNNWFNGANWLTRDVAYTPNCPSPDYPSAIVTAGLTSAARCGKNLYNNGIANWAAFDGCIWTVQKTQTGIIISTDATGNNFGVKDSNVYTVLPNTTYTVKVNVNVISGAPTNPAMRIKFTEDSTYTGYGQILTFNTGSHTKIQGLLYAGQPNVGPCQVEFSNIQAEVGSTATEYEPYDSGQTVDLSSVGLLRAIPVPSDYATPTFIDSGGQAWVADTLDMKTGVLTRRVGEKIFDGTEAALYAEQTAPSHYRYFMGLNAVPSNTTNGVKSLCSHFKLLADGMTYSVGQIGYVVAASGAFYCTRDDTTSLTDFKSWLAAQYAAGTPVTVDYILATPTTTQLSANMIQLVPGINNIYSIGGTIRPILKATYCAPVGG